MSARGFRSVFMVGAIASAALGCYLVSLRVASERAALQGVENKIVLAQRDIRLLETEIGTRGRLAQLERWNVKVIRLSAPSADQFVDGAFQLATLTKPDRIPTVDAPVVLASAQITPRTAPALSDDSGTPPPRASRPLGEMMHVASYSKPTAPEVRAAIEPRSAKLMARAATPATKAATATKPVKTALADPLAPLSAAARKAKSEAGAVSSRTVSTTKESGAH